MRFIYTSGAQNFLRAATDDRRFTRMTLAPGDIRRAGKNTQAAFDLAQMVEKGDVTPLYAAEVVAAWRKTPSAAALIEAYGAARNAFDHDVISRAPLKQQVYLRSAAYVATLILRGEGGKTAQRRAKDNPTAARLADLMRPYFETECTAVVQTRAIADYLREREPLTTSNKE